MTQTETPVQITAGTWAIDPVHSEVGFSVRHLMSKVRGTFTDFTGEITTTGVIEESRVAVTIRSASITTNNEQRDGHLRSADFFDPASGGELSFVSTGVRAADEGYVISGDLTINGTTHPVELAAEFLGTGNDAFGNTLLGAEATTSINRKDYGVNFNIPLDGGKLVIGDKVEISLSIEARAA